MTRPAAEGSQRRVLVADDSRSMRMLLSHTLEAGGYEVRMVEDGDQLRDALKVADAPRVVVTDWQMPGPSGVEICRDLRQRPGGERFHVIIVTANAEPDHLLEALQAGANDFIRKPFSPAELLARVNAGQRVTELQGSLETKIAELATALTEVRTLKGLIPICMHCHRIRTATDDWQKLEAYLEANSEAVVSHGLCEECLEKHYPETPESEGA